PRRPQRRHHPPRRGLHAGRPGDDRARRAEQLEDRAGTERRQLRLAAPVERSIVAVMSESPLDELTQELRGILDRIPAGPGVYLMKDRKGRIIYIGKASNPRNRVRSYFNRSGDARAFVALLGRLLGDVETVVTNNEKEALLLENNLIKKHQPRYNVKLVDDKNYLVLRLDPQARYPRLEVTRRIGTDGARYFGPYHSATSCRQTL